jgi:hypothetical protein
MKVLGFMQSTKNKRSARRRYLAVGAMVAAASLAVPTAASAAEYTGDPIGALDVVAATPGGFRLHGWTVDPDTAAPTKVHVYVNGGFYRELDAGQRRVDVGDLFPFFGPDHGYSAVLPAPRGSHQVCTYAINAAGIGTNTLLGCARVQVGGPPTGVIDHVDFGAGTLQVTGWSLDPDTAGSTSVHAYVDGRFAGAADANGNRPDVAAAFPTYGSAHGYTVTVAAPVGDHQVCVYGIDIAGGDPNTLLDCFGYRLSA